MSPRLGIWFLLAIPLVVLARSTPAHCGYVGPVTVVRGVLGNARNEFGLHPGDTVSEFPRAFCITDQMEIVVADLVNKRLSVFGPEGNLLSQFQAKELVGGEPRYSWPGVIACGSDRSVYTYNWDYRLQKYSLDGALLWSTDVDIPKPTEGLPHADTHLIAGLDNSLWLQAVEFWQWGSIVRIPLLHFSATGELITKHPSWPVDLGLVEEERLSETARKIRVIFPEKTWTWAGENACYGRPHLDSGCNLACVGDGTVYRVNDMTSTIAEFRLPGRMLEVEGRNGERRSEYAYIGPVLAPNGDVYAIKEPGNTFEIVRWRWEEDPSVPTDLVATPAAERVVLSWKVPRVDGDEITGYEIFRASRRCGTYSHVGTVPQDKTEFQDTQLPSSTSLFYKVRAISGNRQSAFSTCAMMQR